MMKSFYVNLIGWFHEEKFEYKINKIFTSNFTSLECWWVYSTASGGCEISEMVEDARPGFIWAPLLYAEEASSLTNSSVSEGRPSQTLDPSTTQIKTNNIAYYNHVDNSKLRLSNLNGM